MTNRFWRLTSFLSCVCSHYLFHSDAQWSHPNTDICSCLVYFRRCPFRTLRHSVHIHRQCLYKKLKLKNFIGEDDTFFKFQKFIRSKKIDFEKQVDICGSFLLPTNSVASKTCIHAYDTSLFASHFYLPCVCSHYLFHSDAQWHHLNTDMYSCLACFHRCLFRTNPHPLRIHRCLYENQDHNKGS